MRPRATCASTWCSKKKSRVRGKFVMLSPDERTFQADLEDAPFQIGVQKGHWAVAEPSTIPDGLEWPYRIFWVGAAPRQGAPNRFYLGLDCQGYAGACPTGPSWNPEKKELLAATKWPSGGRRASACCRRD